MVKELSAVLAVTLDLRASSGWVGLHGADACTPWGSGSSLTRMASSTGVREAKGSSSMDSSKEASQMSSSSSCVRGTRHLHRSWTVPHIAQGGAPNCSAQYCKTLASTTVCSLLTSWKSLVHQNMHSSVKSHHLRQLRQGGAFHQPILSYWAASNLEPAACFFASSCTCASLSYPGLRDWSSGHQLGASPFSAR